jgi:hypothetical protein
MSTSEIKRPAGSKWEPTATDLATDAGRRTTEDVWCCVRWCLVYPSAYATFAIFSRQEYRTATREDAKCDPEKYDLLRAQGGWTEFFVTMFPARQTQHGRRPVESAEAHE